MSLTSKSPNLSYHGTSMWTGAPSDVEALGLTYNTPASNVATLISDILLAVVDPRIKFTNR